MKIITLGPKGTFSHQAALNYGATEIEFKKTVRDVFESVDTAIGLVPIENSVSGTVGLTLDALMDFSLNIVDELILPVKHYLAGFGSLTDIKIIYSHPQSYAQCEHFLRKNFPDVEIIETSSNGKSAEMVAKLKDKTRAAIVPKIAAELYDLKILKSNIQDNRFNVTRFIVIATSEAKRTGYDRTSIAIYPQIDRPGLLYDLLGEFAKRKINLTKIESRPSKGKLGDYIFFIDFEGHKEEPLVKEALNAIEKEFFLKVLGSYPRKY